jgi:uncharacterized protein YndB with AHSA1/START domain
MAVVETHVDAPPERCFAVLSDPRSYAYWVVGSREIRDADPDWPAKGSKFHHTVEGGIRDHTVVEEVEPNRRLRMRAKARPFGTAFVTVTMRPQDGGSQVTMEEEPADRVTRLLFNPLLDRLLHTRNEDSVARLKELAEGRVPMPEGDLEEESVESPGRAEREGLDPRPAAGFGHGCFAGLLGGLAMSASTLAEMRLTGRDASRVPVEAVERLLGVRVRGAEAERRVTTSAHFLVSGLAGGAWGAIASTGLPSRLRAPLLYALASAPDVVAVPAARLAPPPWRWSAADVARTVGHHAVFTAVTHSVFSRLER